VRPNDMILISVDDHVVEPRNLFDGRVPAKYADQAPRVITRDDGADVWLYEGKEITLSGLNAVAGKTPEEYSWAPTSYGAVRAGCYDQNARVADMNRNGVLASMCFPSFARFCGDVFCEAADKEAAAALVGAYNDWHIDDWCASSPGRFIPLAILPFWDPAKAAAEVARVAAKGCYAVTFPEDPTGFGLPSFHDTFWDPFYAACVDNDVLACLHIGTANRFNLPEGAPIDVALSLTGLTAVHSFTNILWSPLLNRFPSMRFVLSEGGIGWLPSTLERVDEVYRRHRFWTGQDLGGQLPSERAREVFTYCFIEDQAGIRDRELIGVDNITWECDYPHSASTWPLAAESVAEQLAGLTDDEVDKITWRNAVERFRFDPFAYRPRYQCTVGALRAAARQADAA
jgi:predicted TIM-barrel fold metal-dependent hydrolase